METPPFPRIRAARPSDAPGLARVHIASWQAAYTHLYPPDVLGGLSLPGWTERWKQRIAEAGRTVRLLDGDAEGEIAGFSMYGATRDRDDDPDETGELYALYLGPTYWGSGYAAALWDEARQSLASSGFGDVTVWVLRDNFRARGFYEKVGFVHEPNADKELLLFGVTLPEVRCRQRLLGLSPQPPLL